MNDDWALLDGVVVFNDALLAFIKDEALFGEVFLSLFIMILLGSLRKMLCLIDVVAGRVFINSAFFVTFLTDGFLSTFSVNSF